MKADRVEVVRDEQRKNWLIRIQVGDEVIRRYCKEPSDASEEVLRAAALKTVADEGYSIDPSNVLLQG
jgi:hypothetical protein